MEAQSWKHKLLNKMFQMLELTARVLFENLCASYFDLLKTIIEETITDGENTACVFGLWKT